VFTLEVPWWELIARGAAMYLTVLLLLRTYGKRQTGELTPFDLVVLLLISEAASPALTGSADSWLASSIVVTTLLALNWLVGVISSRSKRVENLLEGQPQFLVRNGKVDYAMLRREAVSHRELMSALREAECFTPHQAEYAVLEASGRISVKKRDGAPSEPGAHDAHR
jgi:uncharacterized membrane protein YcaP (DUF421 family)